MQKENTKMLIALTIALILLTGLVAPALADQGPGGSGKEAGWGVYQPKTFIDRIIDALWFFGGKDLKLGIGVDQLTSPWVIVGERYTFPDNSLVYSLATLTDVETSMKVLLVFTNRDTGAVKYSYSATIPDPASQGYSYWVWYCVFAYSNAPPAGNYRVTLYLDGIETLHQDFTVYSANPTPTPTPTPTPAPPICTQGQRTCVGADLFECQGGGYYWVKLQTCTLGCQNGACVATPTPTPTATPTPTPACSPGSKKCNGNDLLQCNAAGTGWTKIETCASGCQNGACLNGPTPTPTSTPMPTPTPTPNIPGFEAVFAISGLLAIAFVLIRR